MVSSSSESPVPGSQSWVGPAVSHTVAMPNQSDDLGFKYALTRTMTCASGRRVSDPRGKASCGCRRLPEWLSTTPIRRTGGQDQCPADSLNRDLSNAVLNERVYHGSRDHHGATRAGFSKAHLLPPRQRFQLEFPRMQTHNTPSAVVAVIEKQDSMCARRAFDAHPGIGRSSSFPMRSPGGPASPRVKAPAPRSTSAQTSRCHRGHRLVVSYSGRTFGLMAYTGQGSLPRYDGTSAMRSAASSVRTHDSLDWANRLEIVKVSREMTLYSSTSSIPPRFHRGAAIINQVEGRLRRSAGDIKQWWSYARRPDKGDPMSARRLFVPLALALGCARPAPPPRHRDPGRASRGAPPDRIGGPPGLPDASAPPGQCRQHEADVIRAPPPGHARRGEAGGPATGTLRPRDYERVVTCECSTRQPGKVIASTWSTPSARTYSAPNRPDSRLPVISRAREKPGTPSRG